MDENLRAAAKWITDKFSPEPAPPRIEPSAAAPAGAAPTGARPQPNVWRPGGQIQPPASTALTPSQLLGLREQGPAPQPAAPNAAGQALRGAPYNEGMAQRFSATQGPRLPDGVAQDSVERLRAQLRGGGAAGEAVAAEAAPGWRAGLAAEGTPLGKAAYGAGRLAGAGVRAAGGLAPAALGGQVISHFNDYKLNEPGVDSSAGGTWDALKAGDMDMVGKSLRKGAVETFMDVNSAAANLLDYVVPGKAPVSSAYDRTLREQLGSTLAPHQAAPAAPTAAPALPEPAVDMTPDDTPRGSVADSIAAQQSLRAQPQVQEAPATPVGSPPHQPYAPGQVAMSGMDAAGSYYYTGDGRMLRPEQGLSAADAQIVAGYNERQALRAGGQVQEQAPQQQQAATPANANVAAFQKQYGGAADKAGRALGVDPNLLLAQWGNETGWGKSVIPGTNNLGNIKDVAGGGVRAVDNATGSNDKYRQFASADAFADHYVKLVNAKYKGAVGAGADAGKFAAGLKGYAEDPQYGAKLAAAYGMLGGQAAQSAAPQQAAQAQPQRPQSLREQAVRVQNAGGLEDYYEVPDGTGGYAKVPAPVFQAGVAGGNLAGAVNGFRASQAEGAADRVDPNRLERSKVDAQLKMAEATRAQTAEMNKASLRNIDRDNDRADLAAREASTKHLGDYLSTVLTKDDGKGKTIPDLDRVAEASQAMHAEVGETIRQLQRDFPAGHPQYGAAQKQIKALETKGVGAFDDADLQVMASQFQIMERARENHGPWTPGGSEFVQGPLSGYALDPEATKNKGGKLFGSDMAVLQNNTRIRKNDLRYKELSNRILVDVGKVPTRQFDAGLRGK